MEQLAMQKEAAEMEFRDRELKIKEHELGIKDSKQELDEENSEAKRFKDFAAGVKSMADAEEAPKKTILEETKIAKAEASNTTK